LSTSNFYIAPLDFHSTILWWEINVTLKWMCACAMLGGMYVELNELTAYDSYLSSNFN